MRAEQVALSTSTQAVLSKSGVVFIRGSQAWHLSSRELGKLVEAVSGGAGERTPTGSKP